MDDVWPAVAAQLKAMLRHRGVDAATAEDVVQETAVRVLRHRVTFVDADDLFRWTAVVAWRLAIDVRREAGRLDVGPLPERQSNVNVALAVEHRSALEAVGRGLQALSEADRGAILAPLRTEHPGGDRAQAAAAAVRRHRARTRLLAATKGFLGVLGWLAVPRRHGVSRRAVAAAAATPVLIMALTLAPQMQAGADDIPPATPSSVEPPPTGAPAPARAVATVASEPVRARPADVAPATSRAETSTTAASADPLPPFRVEVANPAGGRTVAGGDPGRPGDKLVCVTVAGGESSCVDAPPVDAPVDPPVQLP